MILIVTNIDADTASSGAATSATTQRTHDAGEHGGVSKHAKYAAIPAGRWCGGHER